MSIRACLLGVVQRLRVALGDEAGTHVGISLTLRPPPGMGQWYVAVGQGTDTVNDRISSGDVVRTRHTVSVGITCRYAWVPPDRQGELATHSFDFANLLRGFAAGGRDAVVERPQVMPGILELAEWVHDLLIVDYECLTAMNRFLGRESSSDAAGTAWDGDSEWGFCEPFQTGSTGSVQDASAEWVGGTAGDSAPGDVQTLVLTVSGAVQIKPARYARGLDRNAFTGG